MSTWTHVAGVIRFDAIRNHGVPNLKPDIEQDIPEGSEGPLFVTLWENPDRTSLAAYTVTIFGDLRDFSSVQEIAEYLERLTKWKLVRQGVCTVDVEGSGTVALRYFDQRWEIVDEVLA